MAAVKERISQKGVGVLDVRLNGSAASYIVAERTETADLYNDLDFLFILENPVDISIHFMFDNIRTAFFECLLEVLRPSEKSLRPGVELI